MHSEQVKIIIGALLHDIGKVAYRSGDGRNHSKSGYDFLKNDVGIVDNDILEQVLYHHGKNLASSNIDSSSLAYITYMADNIAAKIDRRENDNSDEVGFDKFKTLDSIFNILNGNNESKTYEPKTMSPSDGINYPTNKNVRFVEKHYSKMIADIKDELNGMEYKSYKINSILEILEGYLTYVPSSTSRKELADISLYDHVKITAALASCMYEYLEEQNIKDYKEELFKNAKDFYDKKVFLLYSMDISGIQDFIYTISSKNALKALRSRSFYLEIMMEHIIDELLEEIGLSRANRIYCGGGHMYMFLPNTNKCKNILEKFERKINNWFLDNFKTVLYIAGGYSECSANELNNTEAGSYKALFRNVSMKISDKKMHRYSFEDIKMLNSSTKKMNTRECSVCKRVDKLVEKDGVCKCSLCARLEAMSNDILYGEFFVVIDKDNKKDGLPLPNDKYLISGDWNKVKDYMTKEEYVRCYSKNKFVSGYDVATKLWVGDYIPKDKNSFGDFAKEANGIKRIAVLRADVDNLGQTFVSGFERKEEKEVKDREKYVTISRTATLSRMLSLFFKKHINSLLKDGDYDITYGNKDDTSRKVSIVYSGGDDVFVVGAWDEVIGFAIDLNDAVKEFGQGTISISAGIGIYPEKYPISVMARQVGKLEDMAKNNEDNKNGEECLKDSIALFDKDNIYTWDIFINKVMEEKYSYLVEIFGNDSKEAKIVEHRKSFLYKMLELIRHREDKINIARYAYILARLEEDMNTKEENTKNKEKFKEFSYKMYKWINDKEDSKQLITAIYLYIYSIREKKED